MEWWENLDIPSKGVSIMDTPMSWVLNLRGSLGENNFYLGILYHCAPNLSHNRHVDDVPPFFSVPPGVISQKRIPAEGKRVVPTS